MKKGVLLFLSLSLIFLLSAQKGFDIGVTGTFENTYIWRQNNYGTLVVFGDPIVRQSEMNYKPTWGGQGGIQLGYNFTNNWGLKLGIEYCSTGQGYEDNFEGPAILPDTTIGSKATRVNVKRYVRLGYVVLPLLAKFTTTKGRTAKFFIALGPQFAIRTYAYEVVQIGGHTFLPDSLNFSVNKKFQRFDAGLTLQFGTDIYATDHLYFEIGLSGYVGLFDINGSTLQNLGWYDKNHVKYQASHNTSAGLMVGVHYIFGRGRDD